MDNLSWFDANHPERLGKWFGDDVPAPAAPANMAGSMGMPLSMEATPPDPSGAAPSGPSPRIDGGAAMPSRPGGIALGTIGQASPWQRGSLGGGLRDRSPMVMVRGPNGQALVPQHLVSHFLARNAQVVG